MPAGVQVVVCRLVEQETRVGGNSVAATGKVDGSTLFTFSFGGARDSKNCKIRTLKKTFSTDESHLGGHF
jgi:hypothetical protein